MQKMIGREREKGGARRRKREKADRRERKGGEIIAFHLLVH